MRTTILLAGGALGVAFTLACGGLPDSGGPGLLGGGPAIGEGAPLYGDIALSGGFNPDPHAVQVRAGGTVRVADAGLPSTCVGFIEPGQPDVRLNYDNPASTLRFAACAPADTALVIRAPNGAWTCNDDAEGTNPNIEYKGPRAGVYDVWVASYSEGSPVPAELRITEREGGICARIEPDGPPVNGTFSLSPGFTDHSARIDAGGSQQVNAVGGLGPNCTGYVNPNGPGVRIELTGTLPELVLASCANTDTTLIVRGPDGTWHCNDDAEGTNPVVRVPRAAAGTWDVFAGTFGENNTTVSSLRLREGGSGPMCSGPK